MMYTVRIITSYKTTSIIQVASTRAKMKSCRALAKYYMLLNGRNRFLKAKLNDVNQNILNDLSEAD